MASIIKKKVKKYTYFYLVESARVNGKPRIVSQKYLGTVNDIAKAVDLAKGAIPEPEYSTVLDFGDVCALFEIANRLGVSDIINSHAGKRSQGLPVGDTMLLAAINRAVRPKSKKEFFRWFDKTVLHNLFPGATKKNLSSQGFWNNMSLLTEEKIRSIEDELTKTIVERYGLSTECLLFDNTNFYTYIDTSNPSVLAKRGNSKQKRSDLKIIGLSLMVSPDSNIPLFHETYSGNKNDAKRFSEVIGSLKERYQKIQKAGGEITLIFDKGNNNDGNIDDLLNEQPCKFHFVGGLRLSQCAELLDIPKSEYAAMDGESLSSTTVYRTTKYLYSRELTVLATYNPLLYKAQLEGVLSNIDKCAEKLRELQAALNSRAEGAIVKGRKPTVNSVTKRIETILSAQHMKEVFICRVCLSERKTPEMLFSVSDEKLDGLKERVLGKSVLFTDRSEWTNEKIISSYRSQYHIEDCFKQMKDTEHLGFRPILHWTDHMIRVHAFYCILSFALCSILKKEVEKMGHAMSINAILDMLKDVQQVITVFSSKGKKHISKSSFSRLDGIAKEIVDNLDLMQYQIKL